MSSSKLHQHKLAGSSSQSLAELREEYSRLRERSRQFGDLARGVPYSETLAGRNGMSFVLLPDPHHTASDVAAAACYLRLNRDVVSLCFVRIEQ